MLRHIQILSLCVLLAACTAQSPPRTDPLADLVGNAKITDSPTRVITDAKVKSLALIVSTSSETQIKHREDNDSKYLEGYVKSSVCDAPVEGAAIGAVGSAPNSTLGVDFMKQQAVANARDLLAKQNFSTVHVAIKKSVDKSTGAVSKETVSNWTTPQPIIDQVAQDSKVLKDIIGPDGAMYVYVALDEAATLKLKELVARLNK